MTYEFSYRDNEGDLYESEQYPSKREANDEIARLYKMYDGDFQLMETWIYNDDNEFQGRWR